MTKTHRFSSDDPRERALAEAHELVQVVRGLREEGARVGDTRDNGEARGLAEVARWRRRVSES